MKHKSIIALLIAGLLMLSACEDKPSDVSEGDKPQSEAVSEAINSENISSTEDKSTPESSDVEESSEEPSEESSEELSEESSDGQSELDEYRMEYSGYDEFDRTKASIIRDYLGDGYGVASADDKVLYECKYHSAYYYGYETLDIIILGGEKGYFVLDAWGKEIELQGDGEYTGFNYINGAIAAYDEKAELYTLFRLDGTKYENIPSFKTVQQYPTAALAITYKENGAEKGAYLKFTGRRSFELVPYGEAERKAAEAKYRNKIVGVFNSFTDALRSGDKKEMRKYATEDLVYYVETGFDDNSRRKHPNLLKGMLAFDNAASIEEQRIDPDEPVFFYIDDSKGGVSEGFFMLSRYQKEYGYDRPVDGEPIGITVVCDGNGGFKLDIVDAYCQEDLSLLYERYNEHQNK